MAMEEKDRKGYFAFISYKREDAKWADWLQHELEHYRLPSNLNGREDLPKTIRPVFKDTSELNPTCLPRQIQEALADSRYLIVICSPRSAKSEWVNKEVETFVGMGKTDCIIPFIIEGKTHSENPATECYPKALRELPANQEILGANINEYDRNAALVKVVAQMLGLKFDTLWQRYARDLKKKRRLLVTLLLSIIVGVAGIAYYTWSQNNKLKEANTALLRSQIQQELSMSRNYLLLRNPVMAMTHMTNVSTHMELLDSIQKVELQELTNAANDSLSNCPIILCDITNNEKPVLSAVEVIKKSSTIKLKYMEDVISGGEWYILTFPVNKKENRDTIHLGNPEHRLITNWNYKYIAFDNGYGDYIEPEISNKGKGGIGVYSIETGEQTGYVSTFTWYEFLTYPIALSSDGNKIIYKEEDRTRAKIYLADFKKKTRTTLKEWATDDSNSGGSFTGAYSPDGNMFYIIDEDEKRISLYDGTNLKVIYEFDLEKCDLVQWDKDNKFCVSLNGHTLKWKRNTDKSYFERTIKALVADVCISDDGRYVAATSKMGELYIWSRDNLSCLWHGKMLEDADHIEFTHDGKNLWLATGYNEIMGIDWGHGKKLEIKEDIDNFAPHPWSHYIYITDDDKYCITYFSYRSQYNVYDIKNVHYLFSVDTRSEDLYICYMMEKGLIGFVHDNGVDVYTINGKMVNKSVSKENKLFADEKFDKINCDFIDYTSDTSPNKKDILTCKKISPDGAFVVEGYYDGRVKVIRNKK